MEKETKVKVRNRDNGEVGYFIPDLGNLNRTYMSGEVKEVTFEELQKLSYIPGGMSLLENYLVIENEEAIAELLGEVEPEYNYSEEDIKKLLLEGSLDELLDCLDFAPEGVINIVKSVAVKSELNDIAKREAILNKTGFNVTNAIRINKESAEDLEEQEVKTGRRAAAPKVAQKENKSSRYRVVA